jgi:hypothetical protein
MGWDHLPASVAFCDVETTGLGNDDRIVSFGGIGMISRGLAKGRPNLEYLYLVFDPGRANRRAAEQIHGFSDSALRLQDPFAVHAAEIWRFRGPLKHFPSVSKRERAMLRLQSELGDLVERRDVRGPMTFQIVQIAHRFDRLGGQLHQPECF